MLDHHPLIWYMSHRICRCNFSVEATNHRSSLKIGDDWIRTGAALSQNQKVQLLRTSSGPHPLLNSVLVFSCQSWVVNDILDFQVANLGRLFRVPQVSYLSTSVTFCNREKFPFFFRTVPSDIHQADAILEVCIHMWYPPGWRYPRGLYPQVISTRLTLGLYPLVISTRLTLS